MISMLPSIIGASAPATSGAGLVSLGSAAIGGLASIFGANKQNAANAKQAALNRQFQERMSSTSHQREVKDLRAAGLNPILSASKGASTPGGAQAQMQNTMEQAANSAANLVHIKKQVELLDAQRQKVQNEADIINPNAMLQRSITKTAQKALDLAGGGSEKNSAVATKASPIPWLEPIKNLTTPTDGSLDNYLKRLKRENKNSNSWLKKTFG